MPKRIALLVSMLAALLLAAGPAEAASVTVVTVRNTAVGVIWPFTVQVCVAASPVEVGGWANLKLSEGLSWSRMVKQGAGGCSPWTIGYAGGAVITQVQACDQRITGVWTIVTVCSDWMPVNP